MASHMKIGTRTLAVCALTAAAAASSEHLWEVPATSDAPTVIRVQCLEWPGCEFSAGWFHRNQYLLNERSFELGYLETSDYTVERGDIRHIQSANRIVVYVVGEDGTPIGDVPPLGTILDVFMEQRGYTGAHQYASSRCEQAADCTSDEYWRIKKAVLSLADHPDDVANRCAFDIYVDEGYEERNGEFGLDASRLGAVLRSFHRDRVGTDGNNRIMVLTSDRDIRDVASDIFVECCAKDSDRRKHRLCDWSPIAN
ncbi:MAG: hypothetical protein OXH15_22965 [Gammaproteobacteria bacterium]|nr:hypothetical protein [Gammaproteobacteria bacterium]